jgi:hypothetical protein
MPIIYLTADGIGSPKEKPHICTIVRKGRQTSLPRPWYLRGSWRSGEASGVGGGGGCGNTRRLQKYSKGPDLTLENGCLQDCTRIRFSRCCIVWSYLDCIFGGYYGVGRKFLDVIFIESHLKGSK